jgi:hypothetical protein
MPWHAAPPMASPLDPRRCKIDAAGQAVWRYCHGGHENPRRPISASGSACYGALALTADREHATRGAQSRWLCHMERADQRTRSDRSWLRVCKDGLVQKARDSITPPVMTEGSLPKGQSIPIKSAVGPSRSRPSRGLRVVGSGLRSRFRRNADGVSIEGFASDEPCRQINFLKQVTGPSK